MPGASVINYDVLYTLSRLLRALAPGRVTRVLTVALSLGLEEGPSLKFKEVLVLVNLLVYFTAKRVKERSHLQLILNFSHSHCVVVKFEKVFDCYFNVVHAVGHCSELAVAFGVGEHVDILNMGP